MLIPARRVIATLAVLLLLGVTACTPPETPPSTPAIWAVTSRAAVTTPGATVERPLTATSTAWWAVVDMAPGVPGEATLMLVPRSGPDGSPEPGAAQAIPLGSGVADLAMSDHVVAVRRGADVLLYELDTATRSWALGATVPYASTGSAIVDVSDDHLVVGSPTISPNTGDGWVAVVPIALGGPGISWSSTAVRTLSPDPAWTESDRSGFGRALSVEGDTLAISSGNDHVGFYRWDGSDFELDHTLTNPIAPGESGRFGRSVSVDTSTGQARVLVGTTGSFGTFGGVPTPGRVELHVRTGASWSLQTTISPRPTNALGGFALGNEAALDGRWVTVGIHWGQVPANGGGGLIDDYAIELWDLQSGTPAFVRLVSPLAETGGPAPGQTNFGPVGAEVAGSHVVFVGWAGFGLGPSHYTAFSVDRHPGS